MSKSHAFALGGLWLLVAMHCVPAAASASRRYLADGQTYTYSLKSTGENPTFAFDRNPGSERQQLQAVRAVFAAVYANASIAPTYARAYSKEGARCFVFPADFHAYTACFLPNDYAPDQRERFWGFVSRLPNLTWLLTWNLLPALLIVGGFVFLHLRR